MMEAGAGRVRDDSPSQAEAVAEGQHQRQERRRRRRRRRASYHRTASSNLHQRGLRAYRVSIYSRNLIASLARVIRGDGEHAVGHFLAYHCLRALLYSFSFCVYVAAQIHDEESTNTEVFRMESGPVGVIQDIVVFIALVDTVIRAVAHVHAPILTHVDFINVFLTVTVALRLAFDWYDGNFIVPNFLHIWALRGAALSVTTGILRMCQRSSDIVELTVSMLNLILTLFCVVITSMCGVEHLEKGNENNFTLFTALWFVVVTFSTVGYGDYAPMSILGQLFVMGMIIIAFIILPEKIARITEIQRAMKEKGRSYRPKALFGNKHVVLIGGDLDPTTVDDFLIEMRSPKMAFPVDVVILSPHPISQEVNRVIHRSSRRQGVRFITGSAMNPSDLRRAAVEVAEAIFIMAERARTANDTDRHAVLRAWAVNDYAPDRKLYVQIMLLENIRHVSFAHRVMCFSELRFSLLALSAQCPGISTLLTNMAHAVDRDDDVVFDGTSDPLGAYQQAAQNQVFESLLDTSPVFSSYEGEAFFEAAADLVEQKVCLLGIKRDGVVILNPTPCVHLRGSDVCIYISRARDNELHVKAMGTLAMLESQRDNKDDDDDDTDNSDESTDEEDEGREMNGGSSSSETGESSSTAGTGSDRDTSAPPRLRTTSGDGGSEPRKGRRGGGIDALRGARTSARALTTVAEGAATERRGSRSRSVDVASMLGSDRGSTSASASAIGGDNAHTGGNAGGGGVDRQMSGGRSPTQTQLPTHVRMNVTVESESDVEDDRTGSPGDGHTRKGRSAAAQRGRPAEHGASLPAGTSTSPSTTPTPASSAVRAAPARGRSAFTRSPTLRTPVSMARARLSPPKTTAAPTAAGLAATEATRAAGGGGGGGGGGEQHSHGIEGDAPLSSLGRSAPRRVSLMDTTSINSRASDLTSRADEYVIVQVRLKEHAMYHGSPRHKCHFVEYRDSGLDRERTLVAVSRPEDDLPLTWEHVNTESPIIFHRSAQVRRSQSLRRLSDVGVPAAATTGKGGGSTGSSSSSSNGGHAGDAEAGERARTHTSPPTSQQQQQQQQHGGKRGAVHPTAAGDGDDSDATPMQRLRQMMQQRKREEKLQLKQRQQQQQEDVQPASSSVAAALLSAGVISAHPQSAAAIKKSKTPPGTRRRIVDERHASSDPNARGGGDSGGNGSGDADAHDTQMPAGNGSNGSNGSEHVMHSAESHSAPGHSEDERLEQRKPAFVVLALPPGEPAGSGVYHFIRVLRSATLSPDALLPIVVLVAEQWQLSQRLCKFMALFPLVYYHVGHLETPRSLLRACLRGSRIVLVLAPGVRDLHGENCMIDAPNIMATQNVHDVFPDIKVLTELTHRPNVKFVRFVAADPDDLRQSLSVEEVTAPSLRTGSLRAPPPSAFSKALTKTMANATLSAAATWRNRFQSYSASSTEFLFRQSYASGQVFTTTMLDALLYQSMRPEKESLLEVYRLLLGCEDDNNFPALFSLSEDLVRKRNIKDYGDVCRYFLLKKHCVVLGLKIERVMARSVHESHKKNLFDRIKASPRARLSRTLSGFVLQAILPNPDENFAVEAGDSVFLLQRRLDWRNIHRGVAGMNLTPGQRAVGLLTQYRPSVMAKRWLHKARKHPNEHQCPLKEEAEEGNEGEQQQQQQGASVSGAAGRIVPLSLRVDSVDVHSAEAADDEDEADDDEDMRDVGMVDDEVQRVQPVQQGGEGVAGRGLVHGSARLHDFLEEDAEMVAEAGAEAARKERGEVQGQHQATTADRRTSHASLSAPVTSHTSPSVSPNIDTDTTVSVV